jgi:hypothetical protein
VGNLPLKPDIPWVSLEGCPSTRVKAGQGQFIFQIIAFRTPAKLTQIR